MKTILSFVFLTFLYSCSLPKNTESSQINALNKTVEEDTTSSIKPQTLNGKVITPSQNKKSFSPKKEKSNQ